MKKIIKMKDKYQEYQYELKQAIGKNFDKEFKPELTPKEMLMLGVFGGKYFDDFSEFPKDRFEGAKISDTYNPKNNFYGVDASMPLEYWQKKGRIYHEDPQGWFQWYCRYFFGRRIPEEDQRQIKRWKAMKRHIGQIKKNCIAQDRKCRKKQRQALLHWAYDSRKI